MTHRPQWPEEEDVPGFKKTFLAYLEAVESLSLEFIGLVTEALGLPPDGLAGFFDSRGCMQHRAKVRLGYSTAERDQSMR
jgi:isopenicillin N synthase-like dioxygenase